MASVYDVKDITTDNTVRTTMDDEGFITSTATRKLSIVLDDGTSDDAVTVRNNAPLPRFRDPHPNVSALRVVDVSVTRISVIYYEADISYQSPPRPEGTDEETVPYELPAKIKFSSSVAAVEADTDADGDAIVNVGTDEPVEGITRNVRDLVVVIQKNFLTFDPASIEGYEDKVNSDTFLGYAPGRAKIKSIEATNEVKDDVPYWAVTVVIEFRTPYQTTAAKAWYHRRIHKGFYELKDSKVIRCVDEENNPVTEPVLLTATGARLAVGGTPHFIETKLYESTSFLSLGLL